MLDFSLWFGWLRNGWAVAAACLIGWLLYALWPDQASSPDGAPAPLAADVSAQPGGVPTDSARVETGGPTAPPRNTTDAERRASQARALVLTRENTALRLQNAELATQVSHLSQVLTQQQAMLSESSRLKFFQLRPPSGSGVGATNAMPSPELQRALFLAMARELGWLQTPGNLQSGSIQTNLGGVDFVDLRPGTNALSAPVNLPAQIETEPASTPDSPPLASVSGNEMLGFVGTNVVLAFKSSPVVPTGSELTFWSGDSAIGFHSLGSAVMGNDPLVVTIPSAATTSPGTTLTVTAGIGTGSFTVIGQFVPSNPTPP